MSLMRLVSGMSWSSSAAGLRAAVRLLLLGLFLSTGPASSVGDSERVSVFSGETATLPCSAPYSINDIRKIIVEWTKRGLKDSYVLMFRDGRLDPDEQNPSYKSRVDLAEPELKNRNLAMILKNVTKKDEGLYECHFIEAAARKKRAIFDTEPIKTIDLEVKDSPVLPPEPSPLSLLYLLRHLLVVSPYCVSTLLLVSISSSHQRTGSKRAVSMETSEQGEEYDDIITEHHF